MIQKSVRICEVDVPVVEVDGIEWFPISYITKHILLRSGKNTLLNKFNRDNFIEYIQSYSIYYGEKNTQESKCINKTGLIQLLRLTNTGRLSVDQRKSQNCLHEYLGVELLSIDEQDTDYYNPKWLNELDDYTKDVVQEELTNMFEWYRRCSNCNSPLPLTSRFYPIHPKAEKGFTKICKVCSGTVDYFTHPNKDKQMMRGEGMELFQAMNNGYLQKILFTYIKGEIKRLPDCYENKESYGEMIKILFENGDISKNSLSLDYLYNIGLKRIKNYFNNTELYQLLYGEYFYHFVWKYSNYKFREKELVLTFDIANKIVNNYIKENNLIINDILTYNHDQLFKECRISHFVNGKLLYFIVQYYKFQYPGYMFKHTSVNYYKNEENLLFDLKYLIEQDMKVDINKIPLYLTKYNLQKKCIPLYNYIISNKHGSIYEWVDKLYPNKFIEADFEINAYRNEFGSDDEMRIHEILKEQFGQNVIYNQIHTSRTISIDGMIPDWFVMTGSGVWIVEYFGLYVPRQYGKSSRVTDYMDKTHRKIEEYEKILGYRYLFLYPDDTINDYRGCREKIAKMKEM